MVIVVDDCLCTDTLRMSWGGAGLGVHRIQWKWVNPVVFFRIMEQQNVRPKILSLLFFRWFKFEIYFSVTVLFLVA